MNLPSVNLPLNVFRGLRVYPNKLKIDKKRSRSQRAASFFINFFVSVRTLTVLAHILIAHILIV